MDDELRKTMLTVLRLFRIQQEKLLQLGARVDALQVVLARATGTDYEASEVAIQKIIAQFRELEPDKEARRQVDAIIDLLDKGRNPNIPDA